MATAHPVDLGTPTTPPSADHTVQERASRISAQYYQSLHETDRAFIANNWLVEELDRLRPCGRSSILEVGCGNGRFLEIAASHWSVVVGMDWAKSPQIDAVLQRHTNVQFVQQDLATVPIDGAFELVASADFLEHLPQGRLPFVMQSLLSAGRFNFHKIACYDDGHSHLSIFEAERWLELWHSLPSGQGMRILEKTYRKGNREKVVAILANVA